MRMIVKSRTLFVLALSVNLLACEKARIEGTVVDASERPLTGVTVSIDGSDFSDTTDEDGGYSLQYVPGDIKVNLSKQGYSSASFKLNLAVESVYPAARIDLFEIPKEQGMFLISNQGYINVSRSVINVLEEDRGFSWNKPGIVNTYSFEKCSVPRVPQGKVRFIDTDEVDQTLLRADSEGLLFRFMVVGLNSKNEGLQIVSETSRELAPNVYLRESELTPGLYAIAAVTKGLGDGRGINSKLPSYAFEVLPESAVLPSANSASRTPEHVVREYWELYTRGDKVDHLSTKAVQSTWKVSPPPKFENSPLRERYLALGEDVRISVDHHSCESDGRLVLMVGFSSGEGHRDRNFAVRHVLVREGGDWKFAE
jgi:hypothetical protein